MNHTQRVTKMETGNITKVETSSESVEVAEAIKVLQAQLADLRKIVQAAKTSGDLAAKSGHRQ